VIPVQTLRLTIFAISGGGGGRKTEKTSANFRLEKHYVIGIRKKAKLETKEGMK